jgi:hypothetical protein
MEEGQHRAPPHRNGRCNTPVDSGACQAPADALFTMSALDRLALSFVNAIHNTSSSPGSGCQESSPRSMTSRSPTAGAVPRPKRVLDREQKNHPPLILAHSVDLLGYLGQQLVEPGHPAGDRLGVVPLKQHVVEFGLGDPRARRDRTRSGGRWPVSGRSAHAGGQLRLFLDRYFAHALSDSAQVGAVAASADASQGLPRFNPCR